MQNQTRNLIIVALVAALVAVTCWNQSTGQVAVPAKPAAVKREYTFAVTPTLNQDPAALNKLGAEGWELCVTHEHSGGFHTMIFRRSKAEK